MDFLLNRYRNLTVLLVVIVGQLLLLAYQVKTNKDVPLIRVWAVSTVTPVEVGLEWVRRHTIGYAEDYFVLLNVREENQKLKRELDRTKIENHFLRNELSTADRLKQLSAFQEKIPSKTLSARVIGNGTGANSKVVFIDRGVSSGIEKGMAVITPDGIVGKVVAAYPTASLVMLMTDPSFAAGVISQKNHVHGTLKGNGGPKCKIEYVQNEEKVETGEWFYTAGDDGIFPRGFPVGQVASVRNGDRSKEIYLTPGGWQGGLDEVLIVTEGVHQPVPEPQLASQPVKILPPPTDANKPGAGPNAAASLTTDADRLRREYQQVVDQEKIQLGEGRKPPDFTKLGKPAAATPPPGPTATAAVPKAAVPSAGAGGAAAEKKPVVKPRPPVLETDPTDADPGNEDSARKVQREPSSAPAITGDKNTEILPPAPPPKRAVPPKPPSQ